MKRKTRETQEGRGPAPTPPCDKSPGFLVRGAPTRKAIKIFQGSTVHSFSNLQVAPRNWAALEAPFRAFVCLGPFAAPLLLAHLFICPASTSTREKCRGAQATATVRTALPRRRPRRPTSTALRRRRPTTTRRRPAHRPTDLGLASQFALSPDPAPTRGTRATTTTRTRARLAASLASAALFRRAPPTDESSRRGGRSKKRFAPLLLGPAPCSTPTTTRRRTRSRVLRDARREIGRAHV